MNRKRFLLAILIALSIIAIAALILLYKYNEPYPMLYLDEISQYSTEYDVPQEYLLAIIKTESGFNPKAQSSAGAMGLMQFMPATFEEVAMRLGEEVGDIFHAATSIRYGAYYLAYLYRNFGDWQTVFAAYNAGMGRVSGWLTDARYSDDGITLHTIPIEETRNYINKINKAIQKYQQILEDSNG